MILYLDTSSLVKMYVEEPGSPAVQAEATYLTVVQEFPGERVRFSTADLALDRAARRTARRLSPGRK